MPSTRIIPNGTVMKTPTFGEHQPYKRDAIKGPNPEIDELDDVN